MDNNIKEKREMILQSIRDKIKTTPSTVTDFEKRYLDKMEEYISYLNNPNICIDYDFDCEMCGA